YRECQNSLEQPFLFADKFMQDQNVTHNLDIRMSYLYSFDQNCKDFCEENLTVLEQKIIYEKVHSAYKKALNKALETNSKLQ
ncbi:7945_t:CDS:1, partial [Racocetra fulgida]